MLPGGKYLQILITRRQRLVLNLGTLPLLRRPHLFCSETHCRRGFSPRWMRAVGSCASYSRSIFHPADALNHCWKSPSLPSPVVSLWRRHRRQQHHHPPPTPPKKAPAYCTASSYHWYVSDGLSAEQLGSTYMIVCDAKLQAWRQGLAPTPLFHCSYCVALRACLTFTADNIISAVWEGDKKGRCLLILPPTEHPAALQGLAEKRRRRTPDGGLTGIFDM